MNPGELNRSVSIESKAVAKGASGGQVDTWTALAGMPVSARIRHVGGGERDAAGAAGGQVAERRTVIRIRYRAGVTAQMRVVYGATVFNIRHAANWQEANQWLDLTCDTGVDRG